MCVTLWRTMFWMRFRPQEWDLSGKWRHFIRWLLLGLLEARHHIMFYLFWSTIQHQEEDSSASTTQQSRDCATLWHFKLLCHIQPVVHLQAKLRQWTMEIFPLWCVLYNLWSLNWNLCSRLFRMKDVNCRSCITSWFRAAAITQVLVWFYLTRSIK